MGLHNNFSWHYTKALLPDSSEQGAHAAVQLCWFGFQGEVRKQPFLRRNPSHYHFKTKHSLVSRLWKSLCTGFWWLSKRHSQNFKHFLVCLFRIKQQYILLSGRTGQTENTQVNIQPKWFFKAFSFYAAAAWCRCPSDPIQFLSAWQLMGSTLCSDTEKRQKKGSWPGDFSLPSCVLIHPCVEFYSINNFSYKRDESNQNFSSFPSSLLPSLPFHLIPEFCIFLSISRLIFHSRYSLLLNALKDVL